MNQLGAALEEAVRNGREVHTVRVFCVERVDLETILDPEGNAVPQGMWQVVPELLHVARGDVVVFVLASGENTAAELTFPGRLVTDRGPHPLRPGETVHVTIKQDAVIGATYHYKVRSLDPKERDRCKDAEAHILGFSTGGPGMKVDR